MVLEPKPKPISDVYDLLVRCGYPGLPERSEALPLLAQAANITLCDGDKLVAWVGIHGNRREVSLDFACEPDYRRRWFTPSLYRALTIGLLEQGVEVVRVDTAQPNLIKAALKAGFVMELGSKHSDTEVGECLLTKSVTLEFRHKDYLRKRGVSGKSIQA